MKIKIPLNCVIFVYRILFFLSMFSRHSFAAESLPLTVEKIKPSIVAVGTYMPKRNPRAVFLGTGFAVTDGTLVVTNAHVIPAKLDYEHLEQVGVFYRKNNEDKVIFATEVALDKEHDLAILRLKEGQIPPLKLGNATSAREGQLYAFTGYPIGMVLGLYPVTHRGIISAICPNVLPAISSGSINVKMLQRLHDPYNVFQLDTTAYPGNSGSPLYNTDNGEVIGVLNKVFVQESKENVLSNPSGISYAIPINHVEKLLTEKGLY
jgi:S1-C subfamily serine protease